MTSHYQRWDPCTPAFVVTVLRVMLGLWVVASVAAIAAFRGGAGGVAGGGLLAIALYLLAAQAGARLSPEARARRVVFGLLAKQLVLWAGMAALLVVVKVSPAGFVLGVSILPAAIVLALAWYRLRRRKPSSC